jgi:hypothetical protein
MYKGSLSVLHGTTTDRLLLTGSAAEPFTLGALPDTPLVLSAIQQTGGHVTEFQWLVPPVTSTAGLTSYNVTFTGTSSHTVVQANNGGTATFSLPSNMYGELSETLAWTVGRGVDHDRAWKSLDVGWGDAGMFSHQYSLDAARVPEVRGLLGCVSAVASDGTAVARFGIQSLARSLPNLGFPDLPVLTYPDDGSIIPTDGPTFQFYSWPNTLRAAGPCVLCFENPNMGIPDGRLWRVFRFPSNGSYATVTIPNLDAAYASFEFPLATSLHWWAEAYHGDYILQSSYLGQYIGLGKFTMGWLERYLTFKMRSNVRTVNTLIA